MRNVGLNVLKKALNTVFKKQQLPKVHYYAGEILEMAQQKSGKGVISFASHNGRMLQEHARKEQILNEVFALRPTHNYNVVTQPKTQNFGQVIEDMYGARMKAADDYLRAESLGTSLPEAVEKRREDTFEALIQYAPESPAYGDTYIDEAPRIIKKIFKYAENGTGKVNVTEALEVLKVTPKGRGYDKARAELLNMIDKVVKEGKEVTAFKTIDIAEFDDAIAARKIKFVDGFSMEL